MMSALPGERIAAGKRIGRPALAALTAAALWPAQTSYASAETETFGSYDGFSVVVQVIVYLLVIIGLFYVIVKILAKKNRTLMSGRSIKTLGGVMVGPNKSVQIVEIGSRLYVVGVGEDVHLLAVIDDPEETEHIRNHLQASPDGLNGFKPLAGWWRKLAGTDKPKEPEEMPANFHQVFHEKLQQMSSRRKKVEEYLGEDHRDRSDSQ